MGRSLYDLLVVEEAEAVVTDVHADVAVLDGHFDYGAAEDCA